MAPRSRWTCVLYHACCLSATRYAIPLLFLKTHIHLTITQIMSAHYVAALSHIRSGMKILGEVAYDASTGTYHHPLLRPSTVPNLEIDEIRKLLIRLQIQVYALVLPHPHTQLKLPPHTNNPTKDPIQRRQPSLQHRPTKMHIQRHHRNPLNLHLPLPSPQHLRTLQQHIPTRLPHPHRHPNLNTTIVIAITIPNNKPIPRPPNPPLRHHPNQMVHRARPLRTNPRLHPHNQGTNRAQNPPNPPSRIHHDARTIQLGLLRLHNLG